MEEISGLVMKFKFQIIIATAFSLLIVSLIYIAPSFFDLIAYFWPLLVSTALFLIAVVVFTQTSSIALDSSAEKAGEGLLDYVASTPEDVQIYKVPPPPPAEQLEVVSLPPRVDDDSQE